MLISVKSTPIFGLLSSKDNASSPLVASRTWKPASERNSTPSSRTSSSSSTIRTVTGRHPRGVDERRLEPARADCRVIFHGAAFPIQDESHSRLCCSAIELQSDRIFDNLQRASLVIP